MKCKKLVILFVLLSTFLLACTSVESEDVTIAIKSGIDTIEMNSTFVDEGASARVNLRILGVTIVENTVDTSEVGIYRIVYQASFREITKKAIRYVHVVDTTPPVVTLNMGIDTIYQGSAWIDAGISATDNSLETPTVVIEGMVSTGVSGEYMIKYIVSDPSGNETEMVRYVNVLKTP